MHPLVRGAAAVAVLTALGRLDRDAPPPAPVGTPAGQTRGVDGLPAPCGPGTLPEGPVCLRIPGEEEAARLALEALEAEPPDPTPARSSLGFEQIPRRPERPADPAGYVYPVGTPERPPRVLGGFEGSPMRTRATAAEQGGVHLAARPGEKVVLLALEHQEGPAEVRFAGDLFGPTVVTEHRVQEGGRTRSYLLFHGRLDRANPAATPGAKLEAGAALGFARPSEGGGLIEIYLEARLLREGATIDGDAKKLTEAATAVSIDVRNVLPRRGP